MNTKYIPVHEYKIYTCSRIQHIFLFTNTKYIPVHESWGIPSAKLIFLLNNSEIFFYNIIRGVYRGGRPDQ